jgi:hypothetical protein
VSVPIIKSASIDGVRGNARRGGFVLDTRPDGSEVPPDGHGPLALVTANERYGLR